VTARHTSSAVPLALLWIALVIYASLYPFAPWREGPSDWTLLVRLPWTRAGVTRFDMASNVIGYMPLGALLFIAACRHGARALTAAAVAIVIGVALSYAMEVAQQFVARRVPSRVDLALNAVGTAAGVLVAFAAMRAGVLERWRALRERWFVAGSGGVIVLLLLWPIGLLFPAPVPFGLGQVFDRLREFAATVLIDTPWEVSPHPGFGGALQPPLSAAEETFAVALGLLAPGLLAYTVARPGLRRVLLLVIGVLLGFGATTLSTALNFGPEHAMAWIGPTVPPALAIALTVGVGLAWLPRRAAAGVALVVITALVAVVAQAPTDPYYASSLLRWEQGRFIRFHGLARWIGWLWPYAAIALLLAKLAARDTE
jgi:VanZ family protein